MEIRNDHQKGLSYTEIARKYHMDPRTAKKYAILEEEQEYRDNIPENLQGSEWYENAENSCCTLEDTGR